MSEKLSGLEMFSRFPVLEEWYSDPTHQYAQVEGDKRLLSAEEKIILFGGSKQIATNIKRAGFGFRDRYTVLLACRQEPMVAMEIARFATLVGNQMSLRVYAPLKYHLDRDNIQKVEGLVYVSRDIKTDVYYLYTLPGYLTTHENGLKTLAQWQKKPWAGNPLRRLRTLLS